MQRRTFLQVLIASTLSASFPCVRDEAEASETTLRATNTPDPCPVNTPRRGHTEKYPYVWYYRTEVHNPLKVPVRIVSFTCYAWINQQWVTVGNILKYPLGTKEFVAWYSDGDIPHDGWIAPGKTAVCDPNWTWNKTGSGQKVKWVYQAEDAHGKRYQVGAQVTLQGAKRVPHREATNSERELNYEDLVLIATVPNSARQSAGAALNRAKIDYGADGSRATGFRVRPPDVAHAKAVLKADAQLHQYWISF